MCQICRTASGWQPPYPFTAQTSWTGRKLLGQVLRTLEVRRPRHPQWQIRCTTYNWYRGSVATCYHSTFAIWQSKTWSICTNLFAETWCCSWPTFITAWSSDLSAFLFSVLGWKRSALSTFLIEVIHIFLNSISGLFVIENSLSNPGFSFSLSLSLFLSVYIFITLHLWIASSYRAYLRVLSNKHVAGAIPDLRPSLDNDRTTLITGALSVEIFSLVCIAYFIFSFYSNTWLAKHFIFSVSACVDWYLFSKCYTYGFKNEKQWLPYFGTFSNVVKYLYQQVLVSKHLYFKICNLMSHLFCLKHVMLFLFLWLSLISVPWKLTWYPFVARFI